MEIPRHWREQPTNMRFEGWEKSINDSDLSVFKYPGGEILLTGSYDQIIERFARKGFNQEIADEILFRLWGGVPAESAVSVAEILQSEFELVGGEIRK